MDKGVCSIGGMIPTKKKQRTPHSRDHWTNQKVDKVGETSLDPPVTGDKKINPFSFHSSVCVLSLPRGYTINTMLNHRQSMKSVYSHPGPKRAHGETVYCSACNAELGPGACVRYSPITNDPFCSRHGRTVSRGLRRLVASEADLRLAVSRYPSILRFLDLNKIRLILQRRSKKKT